jgi:hypothetical protein
VDAFLEAFGVFREILDLKSHVGKTTWNFSHWFGLLKGFCGVFELHWQVKNKNKTRWIGTPRMDSAQGGIPLRKTAQNRRQKNAPTIARTPQKSVTRQPIRRHPHPQLHAPMRK